jgi:hypothetical protein
MFQPLQVFPMKLDQQCCLDRRTGQYEIEHRKNCIEHVEILLSPSHSLVRIIKKCLHSDSRKRPTSREILTVLEEMRSTAEAWDYSHYQDEYRKTGISSKAIC